jgi:hypothetical protein
MKSIIAALMVLGAAPAGAEEAWWHYNANTRQCVDGLSPEGAASIMAVRGLSPTVPVNRETPMQGREITVAAEDDGRMVFVNFFTLNGDCEAYRQTQAQ